MAKEASQDYESFYAQQPVPHEETQGEFLVVSFDGKGVPRIKAEAPSSRPVGTGEKRQKKKEALVGVSYTVDAKLRSPEALAESWWIRKPPAPAGNGRCHGRRA